MSAAKLLFTTLLVSFGPAEGAEDAGADAPEGAPAEEAAPEEAAPAAAADASGDDPATGGEVVDEDRATPPGSYQGRVESSPFNRRGWEVMAGVGFNSCARDACSEGGWEDHPLNRGSSFIDADMKLGPTLIFEFGYRPIEYLSITTGFQANYNPVRGRPDHDLFSLWYSTGFNAVIYPVAFSRFDPYIGVGAGFTQLWLNEDNFVDTTLRYNRGNFRLTTGIDIFATQKFMIGPRFDWNVPFAGETCVDTDNGAAPDTDECQSVKDHGDFKDAMPRQFGLVFQFKGRF